MCMHRRPKGICRVQPYSTACAFCRMKSAHYRKDCSTPRQEKGCRRIPSVPRYKLGFFASLCESRASALLIRRKISTQIVEVFLFIKQIRRGNTTCFKSPVLPSRILLPNYSVTQHKFLVWLPGNIRYIAVVWNSSNVVPQLRKSMPRSKTLGAFPIARPQGSFPTHNDVLEWPKKKCNLKMMLRCGKHSIYPASNDSLVAQLKKKSPKLLPRPDTIPLLDSMDLNDFHSEDYLASVQPIESKP